jgi:hypothetical protein
MIFILLSISTLITVSLFVIVCFLLDKYSLDVINKQYDDGIKVANEEEKELIMKARLKAVQAVDRMRKSFRSLDTYGSIEMMVVWYILIAGIIVSVILYAIGLSNA